MKNHLAIKSVIFAFSLLIIASFTSCKDEILETISYKTQISYLTTTDSIRAMEVAAQSPRSLEKPGRIYIYGDYLFINDVRKGIHVVDNSNPANPVFLNFINIPGNEDLAVNDNILYADSYVDLLAFDITNPKQIKLKNRVKDVFEKHYYGPDRKLIFAYKDTVITYTQKKGSGNRGNRFVSFDASFASNSGAKGSYGTGGSTAKFTLQNSSLYTVDDRDLKVFNVNNAVNPSFVKTINIGFGIETIFPYQNKLFIGSTTGMHIYDASNPLSPSKLSTYSHVTSCDPVIVEGNYAYVTLRSGTRCNQGINVLEVINITDPRNPKLISQFPMINPRGLAIKDNNLFICEGVSGFKTFNKSDVLKIGEKLVSFKKDVKSTDVIAGPKSIIITGDDGIYQYSYDGVEESSKLLSHINLSSIF